jgi:hypothetical protein
LRATQSLQCLGRLFLQLCNCLPGFGRSRGQAPNPSSRAAKRRGDPGERRAPDVPLDRHASLAMTAVLRPHLGELRNAVAPKPVRGDWRIAYRSIGFGSAPSQILPKVSIERPGASKSLPSASKNFRSFPRIEDYQWLTGEPWQKNCRARRWAGMGAARRPGRRL